MCLIIFLFVCVSVWLVWYMCLCPSVQGQNWMWMSSIILHFISSSRVLLKLKLHALACLVGQILLGCVSLQPCFPWAGVKVTGYHALLLKLALKIQMEVFIPSQQAP